MRLIVDVASGRAARNELNERARDRHLEGWRHAVTAFNQAHAARTAPHVVCKCLRTIATASASASSTSGPARSIACIRPATSTSCSRSDPRWGICAVSLHSAGVRDALAPQDSLYTLAVLDEKPTLRVVGAIKELLVAPESPAAVTERLADPAVTLVTATVTEKGYCLTPGGGLDFAHAEIAHDLAHPDGTAQRDRSSLRRARAAPRAAALRRPTS